MSEGRSRFSVEAMRADDWPAVAAIYAEGIATGIATFGTRERLGKLGGRWLDVVLMERRSRLVE